LGDRILLFAFPYMMQMSNIAGDSLTYIACPWTVVVRAYFVGLRLL
jgi:hypothetical protein